MIALSLSVDVSETARIDGYLSDIAQTGNKNAFEQLYLSTKDAVYGYILSIVKNTHDAEDIVHDSYLSVYRSAKGYTSSGKPMAWIFTIARNQCIGKLRTRSRQADIPEEDWEDYLNSNERINVEDKLILEHCLKDLKDDEREILLLHVLSGLKHREIAQMSERPLSTVLSKYHRALKKMRALLKEENEEND